METAILTFQTQLELSVALQGFVNDSTGSGDESSAEGMSSRECVPTAEGRGCREGHPLTHTP